MKSFFLVIFSGVEEVPTTNIPVSFAFLLKDVLNSIMVKLNTTGIYSLNSYGRWNKNFIKIFQNLDYYSNDMNILHRHCPPKDVIYCYNQLLNYFRGKIHIHWKI